MMENKEDKVAFELVTMDSDGESAAAAKQDTQTRSRARLFSLDFDVQCTDSMVS